MPAINRTQKKTRRRDKRRKPNPTSVNWQQSSRRPRNEEARTTTKPGGGGREPREKRREAEPNFTKSTVRRCTERRQGGRPTRSHFLPPCPVQKTMRPEAVGRVRQQVSHRGAPNKVQTTQRASNRPVGETIAENEALKRARVTKY